MGSGVPPVAPVQTARAVLVGDTRNGTPDPAARVGQPASQQPEGDHGRELGGHPDRGVDDQIVSIALTRGGATTLG